MATIDSSSSFSCETANFKVFYRIPLGRLKVSLHFCDGKIRKVEGGGGGGFLLETESKFFNGNKGYSVHTHLSD